jgi:4'-phosphopantetheinyl transferase
MNLPWRSPPPTIVASRSEVHVWRVQLDTTSSLLKELIPTLSTDEIETADRFHAKIDRLRSLQSRGVLRNILGRYTGMEPSALRLAVNRYQRPHLAPHNNLDFNVSHSADLIVIAVAWQRAVGVDIEYIRPVPNADGVAARFFSAREQEFLQSLAPEQRQRGFFQCWTRKEAYIKALGTGLSTPLNTFTISLHDSETAEFVVDGVDDRAWQVKELDVSPGYVAALAVEAPGQDSDDWQAVCWDWAESPT